MLAGLDLAAEAIERTAEAIGTNIEQAERQEVNRAKQLVFPMASKQTISKMYVLMDGTVVPVVPTEAQGRIGKIEDQRARTKECKLGCVFTQTTVDEEGRPIRDPDSTTYRGAIETAEEFALRIYTEAWRRGWEWASLRIVIGDGAVWIWNLADLHFPGAVQIVDLYHARQHLWAVGALLFPNDSARQERWMVSPQRLLDQGRIEHLVKRLRNILSENEEVVQDLSSEAEYFERNASRIRYPEFRKLGLSVGSGVVEAGCKTVIGSRLKCSGMFWTVDGANVIIALRRSLLNGRFENYWEPAHPA
ncbi:MAG TPA: ISKra4 family transposase [Bryobacteraceae bacterium]|nr:ISKra4 family transposase [Bryobacteraceae bacterium]